MGILYLDCAAGAAGDMLMAALMELCPKPEAFLHQLGQAGIPGISISAEKVTRQEICGTQIKVTWNGREEGCPVAERGPSGICSPLDINALLKSLRISPAARENAYRAMNLLLEAESCVHGVPMQEIHFSRLGTMDALADIVGCCMLINALSPESILASPICVGSGHIRCGGGVLSVPSPATAHILSGFPTHSGAVRGERCTPTGAAILKCFVRGFAPERPAGPGRSGIGLGSRELGCFSGVVAHWVHAKHGDM